MTGVTNFLARLYITIVVFAVIRVISAIFLKETFDAAANDAEQLVRDRLKMKARSLFPRCLLFPVSASLAGNS